MSNRLNLKQVFKEPTRNGNLLDLCLTDTQAAAKVLPRISDHSLVSVTLKLELPATETLEREVWCYNRADWDKLAQAFQKEDWARLWHMDVNTATEDMTQTILAHMKEHIPKPTLVVRKTAHPWLNERAVQLVREKVEAEGTDRQDEAAMACSEGLLAEHNSWVSYMKDRLMSLPKGSKEWWNISRQLQH